MNFIVYIKPYIYTKSVLITPGQKKLLAVRDTDPGFSISPRKLNLSSEESLMFSSTPSAHSSFTSTSSQRQTTPTNYSNLSGPINFTNQSMMYSSYSSPTSSFDRVQNLSAISSVNASFAHNSSISPNVSGFTHHPSFSPGSSFSPGMQTSFDASGLRTRRSMSNSFKSSPVSSSFDRITDLHSLSQYLKELDDKDFKTALSSPDNSSTGASFWSYGKTAMDCTHMLKKYMYQLASRSPQSPTSRNYDSDQSALYNGDIWGKRGVSEDDLYLWTERIRKWICLTIISRLSKEIDQINATLRRIGSEETEIGEVSVSTLKHLAFTKGPHVPSLNNVVPYFDFSSNQEYLVKRIRDLGKDGCMSEFVWNSGGHYGKAWGEHLPTDAGLAMHMLCTYMDARLPAQPKYPDGKTFTSQYFVKTPDKPNLDKDDTLCIYQSAINPPHFQVVIGKTSHNLPKGRNNMFQAMLLFLHHIKTKEHGMLGRVNLGMSGINVLWIFNS